MKLTIQAAEERMKSIAWNVEEYQYDENREAIFDEDGNHIKIKKWENYPELAAQNTALESFLRKLNTETV